MATVEQGTPYISPVLQARLDIQSDIDIYARAIIDLKTRLNTLTPIGRLPPELLSEILVRGVIDEDDRWPSDHYYSRLAWIKLAHVCRHFRAVALSTPRFWSHLRLVKSDVFAELLTRSKSAPLHIKAHVDGGSKRGDRMTALEMLLPHSHRIKELHIDGPSKAIQSFCTKTVSPFDALEKLDLATPVDPYFDMSDYQSHLPAVVPILASSAPPPQLRHLELLRFPFRWDDLLFSSKTLTTLVVTGVNVRNTRGVSLPDVGTFDALFSALESAAPRLEALTIEDAIPKLGFTASSPVQLPLPSRTIPLSSIKSICLAGDAAYVAHLLNHISSPSTASLHVTVRNQLGIQELAQCVAAHMSNRPPFLSVVLASSGPDPFILSGWTQLGASRDALLRMTFGLISAGDYLVPILQGLGTFFWHVQKLRISGMFALLTMNKWTNVFTRFPSIRTLVLDEHPWGDMLPALTTTRRLQSGRVYVTAPVLSALHLSQFRFSMPSDDLEPFDELLDFAIFRCNYGAPIDEIHLNACKYATEEKVERLREVVVDVQWDEWEMDVTTEEEEYDSDEC
ncbi:uncharacterized protein TRAVEDRAFT_48456 [Trametes versicolor FP-101664 SS1]|uniref:uncharacterized protein n=1 Tax=Trametes versicolor (strain FP-101664) TaxID=717944 RepID=UPI000462289D|nr:uncharacterized protein TRAVEDRAFT_48456 [Trametes versicolor FP-101664 SS1]EIW57417.1 hypothetical protein TRAVEDRAFT_48456 [Trametes versicolor FP-101664 SS1]